MLNNIKILLWDKPLKNFKTWMTCQTWISPRKSASYRLELKLITPKSLSSVSINQPDVHPQPLQTQ